MTSPFPGMDPFLEGYIWPDVHNELASKIRRQLIPLLQPKYYAHLNIYTIIDTQPEHEIGIMYPDVEIMQNRYNAEEPATAYGNRQKTGEKRLTPPGFATFFDEPVEVKIPVVEIRDTKEKRLVTAIEILSPVNKRQPGLANYLEKRRKLHSAEVHLLEIDLLRRGIRSVQDRRAKGADYLVALTRANQSKTEVWDLNLRTVLPVVPVPLLEGDPDVPLDLQQALSEVYIEAAYHLVIDYASDPPPPELSQEDLSWIKSLAAKP